MGYRLNTPDEGRMRSDTEPMPGRWEARIKRDGVLSMTRAAMSLSLLALFFMVLFCGVMDTHNAIANVLAVVATVLFLAWLLLSREFTLPMRFAAFITIDTCYETCRWHFENGGTFLTYHTSLFPLDVLLSAAFVFGMRALYLWTKKEKS